MDIILADSKTLAWQGKKYRCAIGAAGVSAHKHEGDKVTPAGRLALRQVFYRGDRIEKPETVLPIRPLGPDDGWCDDSTDPMYNQLVGLPYPASCEKLWREDNIYDIIVVLGWNDDPVMPGAGSAIFIHLARDDYSPTDGCIAVSLPDMKEILKTVGQDTFITVAG